MHIINQAVLTNGIIQTQQPILGEIHEYTNQCEFIKGSSVLLSHPLGLDLLGLALDQMRRRT